MGKASRAVAGCPWGNLGACHRFGAISWCDLGLLFWVGWDGTGQQQHPALAGPGKDGHLLSPVWPQGVVAAPSPSLRYPGVFFRVSGCSGATALPTLRLLNYSNFQIAVVGSTSLEGVKMFSLIEHLLPLILSLFKGSFGCCGWDVPGFRYLHVLSALGTAQPCSPQVGCGVTHSLSLVSLGWHCAHCGGIGASWLIFFPHPSVGRARIYIPAPQGASPILPPSPACPRPCVSEGREIQRGQFPPCQHSLVWMHFKIHHQILSRGCVEQLANGLIVRLINHCWEKCRFSTAWLVSPFPVGEAPKCGT